MRSLMLLTFAAMLVTAANASSVVTYQGLLQQGGSPFTGTIDEMLFELYDAESGGIAVAGPISVANVMVSQGMFQAELDFGIAAFESSARWLQITIDGVALVPRQRITAVPFAIRALTDGSEFVLDPDAIYVSIQDPNAADVPECGLGPTGTGTGYFPCQSISAGLARAVALGRTKVLVAHGHYVERVQLSNGVSLFGGYHFDTWERVGGGTTLLDAAGTGHRKTLVASGITMDTTVDGFFIQGRTPTTAGANSYAVWISNSTSALTVENNQITSGNGASGVDGAAGANGMPGVAGLGRDSNPDAYDAMVATNTGACNVSNNRQHANGGVQSCGAVNVSGGPGGGNQCPPSSDFSISSGISGFVGLPSGGAGGDPGYDAVLASAGTLCQSPNPRAAENGSAGASGNPGGSGTGCSAGSGTVVAGEWTGSLAGSGAVGGSGTGGGGGGGGGGAHCESCTEAKDRLGGHGGGGGSGGCGGVGGSGAGAGGASIGIFVVSSGATPTLVSNTIVRGQGGAGGRGGNGGIGGFGGAGGAGGESIFCTGPAGTGGRGGDGSAEGGGGGGCGGPSFGIYVWGVFSPPNYCNFNIVFGGAGGAAGAGGLSLGNSGTAGVLGPAVNCHTG